MLQNETWPTTKAHIRTNTWPMNKSCDALCVKAHGLILPHAQQSFSFRFPLGVVFGKKGLHVKWRRVLFWEGIWLFTEKKEVESFDKKGLLVSRSSRKFLRESFGKTHEFFRKRSFHAGTGSRSTSLPRAGVFAQEQQA